MVHLTQVAPLGPLIAVLCALTCCQGCESYRRRAHSAPASTARPELSESRGSPQHPTSHVDLASYEQASDSPELSPATALQEPGVIVVPPPATAETLAELEALALSSNPTLRRLRQEAAAEWAKANYVAKLPDPSVGASVFLPPMNFEPDRQVSEVQFMQMLPWLARLRAEAQQAYLEAMAAQNMYRAETLRVVGDLRANWLSLYVSGKQIETAEAEQAQLDSLMKTANARVATGAAQPGDVLMAGLELGNLQEQLITYRRQVVATTAEINRLVGRDVTTPIAIPADVEAELPDWNYEFLCQIARESQPELNAARLQTAAARWGIEVARLKRRPDLTLGAGWILMDAPGAIMPDAGTDSFTVGMTTTLPIWSRKYDAMTAEAARRHSAANASQEEAALRIDALLRDLWEQALAGRETLELYEKSILPQARQAFEADQKSLVNNTVAFDRVVRDYRTLLNLQLGYHRARGQLATTLARIQQAAGVDLTTTSDQGSK